MINMQPENDYEDYLRKLRIQKFSHFYNIAIKGFDVADPYILDVGAGSGEVWDNWPKSFLPRVDAVEPNDELRVRGVNKGYFFYSFPSSEYVEVPKYDFVTIMGVLEHVDSPYKFLEEYKDAKRIFLTVPNAQSIHRFLGKRMGLIKSLDELGPQDLAIGHQRIYDQESLRSLLEDFASKYGFKSSIRMGGLGFKFGTNQDMINYGLDRLKYLDEIMSYNIDPRYCAEIYAYMEKKNV